MQRPQSSRARQNSTSTPLLTSGASGRPTHPQSASHEDGPSSGRNTASTTKDASTADEATRLSQHGAHLAAPQSLKREESPTPAGSNDQDHHAPPPAVVTRAGRTSKTATPVTANFPDVPMARSRSTRNAGGGSYASSESGAAGTGETQKRSHKKGVGQTATSRRRGGDQASSRDDSEAGVDGDANEDGAEVEEVQDDDDPEEQRYCYCNSVSYGGMVACDNPDCPREWFHLSCVGLSRPPSSKCKLTTSLSPLHY